jgi:ActR/RegA family two-component response regulator
MNYPATPRLLVVDDEPDLRTLYELALLREGYDIDTAGTVEEAWTLLGAARYSAIITDMRLPDGTCCAGWSRPVGPRRPSSSLPTVRPRTRCRRSSPAPTTT